MFNTTSCIICGYSITDPVCRSCYIKQTKLSLMDLKIDSLTTNFIINKIKVRFPIETLNDTSCILCNKENVTLCRYCFSSILMWILEELNLPDEFFDSFDFRMLNENFHLNNEEYFHTSNNPENDFNLFYEGNYNLNKYKEVKNGKL
jgi:hypothetical protein